MVVAKKINALNIWLNGEFVGEWRRRAGTEEFEYATCWISSSSGRPISISLPFRPDRVYRGDVVKYYFDNLLPDSLGIRERLATKFGVMNISPFDLLAELGRDCVGAIQILPLGEEPSNIKTISCTSLDEAMVANILRNTVTDNSFGLSSHTELRLSLAGAQEKTALLWHDNQWCMPNGSTPTTHIFKLPLGLVGNMKADMHQSVENEWLCLNILSAYGLPVAKSEMLVFEDIKVLVVERFDRRLSIDGSWIIRLPQEDMCQTKGISTLQKYQCDGGMGIADCISVLNGAHDSLKDTRIFFKSQIIFWMLYATDGHSKNFSIQHTGRDKYKLTPLYDVLSISPIMGNKGNQIAKQKAKLAMAIRGSSPHYYIDKIRYIHFIKQAIQVGIPEIEAAQIIKDIVEATPNVIDKTRNLIPESFPINVLDTILDGLLRQSSKLDC